MTQRNPLVLVSGVTKELPSGDTVPITAAQVVTALGSAASDISVNSHKLTSVTDPTSAQDAATKNYVDTHGWNPFASSNVQVKTSSFTAAVGGVYASNASTGNCVMTLPTTHAAGDLIIYFSINWGGNLQVTCPSGHNLCGQAGSVTRSLQNTFAYSPQHIWLWSSSTTDWWVCGGTNMT